MRKPKKRSRSIIIILAVAIFFGIGFFCLQVYIDDYAKAYLIQLDNAPSADAVMVLGALVYSNGAPSSVLEERLMYAYALYQNGNVKKILVSGDHGTKEYDEVNAMKNFLLQKGVRREDIFLDHAGFDTYDSMYRAKEIFKVESLIISTQAFHIGRAVYIARRLGVKAYGYASPDREYYPMEVLRFRESFAKVKAFLDTDILRRKPKFEGEAIPIWSNGILTEG